MNLKIRHLGLGLGLLCFYTSFPSRGPYRNAFWQKQQWEPSRSKQYQNDNPGQDVMSVQAIDLQAWIDEVITSSLESGEEVESSEMLELAAQPNSQRKQHCTWRKEASINMGQLEYRIEERYLGIHKKYGEIERLRREYNKIYHKLEDLKRKLSSRVASEHRMPCQSKPREANILEKAYLRNKIDKIHRNIRLMETEVEQEETELQKLESTFKEIQILANHSKVASLLAKSEEIQKLIKSLADIFIKILCNGIREPDSSEIDELIMQIFTTICTSVANVEVNRGPHTLRRRNYFHQLCPNNSDTSWGSSYLTTQTKTDNSEEEDNALWIVIGQHTENAISKALYLACQDRDPSSPEVVALYRHLHELLHQFNRAYELNIYLDN